MSTFLEKALAVGAKGIPGVKMNIPMTQNTLPGMIGLELEIEGRGLARSCAHKGAVSGSYWATVLDGSLRGEAREYILSTPCTPEEMPDLVHALYATFKEIGTTLRLSNRCSTHVHINMRGRTINLVTSAIVLWTMFEDVVIPWAGEERTTNHFCLSTRDAPASLIPTWTSYLRSGTGNFDRHNLKYTAFNVLPIFEKGSVEVRCGPVPTDANRVVTWATFCHSLIEYSGRYDNPTLISNDLSERGAFEIFYDICKSPVLADFKNDIVQKAGGVDGFNQQVLEGFRRVQGLCSGFPWDDWLALINKTYIPNPFEGKKARPPRFQPAQVPDELDEEPELDQEPEPLGGIDIVEAARLRQIRFNEEFIRVNEIIHNLRAPPPLGN